MDEKHNRIIRIINSKMLQTCYSLIKSNLDNITLGTKDVTLFNNSLNLEQFNKTVVNLQEGKLNLALQDKS